MKQELRCHAVLCPKEEKARQMATCLQERLHQVQTLQQKFEQSANRIITLSNS